MHLIKSHTKTVRPRDLLECTPGEVLFICRRRCIYGGGRQARSRPRRCRPIFDVTEGRDKQRQQINERKKARGGGGGAKAARSFRRLIERIVPHGTICYPAPSAVPNEARVNGDFVEPFPCRAELTFIETRYGRAGARFASRPGNGTKGICWNRRPAFPAMPLNRRNGKRIE